MKNYNHYYYYHLLILHTAQNFSSGLSNKNYSSLKKLLTFDPFNQQTQEIKTIFCIFNFSFKKLQ